jgi:phosphoribosylformylglycinamidine synthase
MREGRVRSCHTPALGGLAAALARVAFAGRLGAELDLGKVPQGARSAGQGGAEPLSDTELLYSESNSRFLVSVAPQSAPAFEALFAGQPCACVGRVLKEPVLRVRGVAGAPLLERALGPLLSGWKGTSADG